MRRHETSEYLNLKTALVALVVLVLLILIIWRPFSNKDIETFEDINNSSFDLAENDLEIPKTDIPTKTLGKDDLCEEYIFRDGDILKILNHEILVEAIGSKSVKILVDGERKILSEEENINFQSGITLGLSKGGLFYYAIGSEHNVAEIMVGCNYGDNPNDKYIQSKGEQYCLSSYNECLDAFGIDD